MDKIFINGLEVVCIVGILPEERVTPQKLIIDVSADCDLKVAGHSGDLRDSVDYAALAELIRNHVVRRRARLLEELGVELLQLILKCDQVMAAEIRITKPAAIPGAAGAGVVMSAQGHKGEFPDD